ncbi:conserved exported protein of unknown function [Tenacibaculum soleae]|uniref:hypothetical protein n=1 Tax=Tenacibaculum soleae TaxID=447689 RepID=UPI0026E23E3C|nr:hypothetical protein [Tenacibaculum soleae]MDO6743914.1 hypothetical protein [Tenacibaculum soleae]
MKNISIIILTLLLLVPPVQAHTDAIIFNDDNVPKVHVNTMDKAHSERHHQNDTEEEKNTEHHHHCISLGISSAIIISEFKFQFVKYFQVKKKIHFYKVLNASNFLDELLQPPQV